jgi:hypothetical protein
MILLNRYKTLLGSWLRACGFAAQQTEADVGLAVLNRMLKTEHPEPICTNAKPLSSSRAGRPSALAEQTYVGSFRIYSVRQ